MLPAQHWARRELFGDGAGESGAGKFGPEGGDAIPGAGHGDGETGGDGRDVAAVEREGANHHCTNGLACPAQLERRIVHFTARGAMDQAVEQARRASDVVGRLRRAVERPDLSGQTQAVDVAAAVRRALYLLEPECQRRGVSPVVEATAPVTVLAEPVALDQIIHNLLMNALQALEQSATERRLTVRVAREAPWGRVRVIDSGPGIAPDVLPRIFEPFFSTRAGGLGLGLSLCETLALHMGGALVAGANEPNGAVFTLTLPLDPDSP